MAYKTKTGFFRAHDRAATAWKNAELLDSKTGELTPMPSMTKQSFVPQCDINNILKQFKATGMLTHVMDQTKQGRYLDLPDDLDFQTSLNTVMQAETAFASLPSKLRNRFENDPVQFLEFMADPANQDEVYELGLATRPLPPENPAPTPGDSAPPKPE